MNKKVVVVETKNLIRAVGIALEYLKRIESKKLQIPGSFLLMIHKPLLAINPRMREGIERRLTN